MRARRQNLRRALALAALAFAAAPLAQVLAQGPVFQARVDRNEVGLNETFTCEITLSVERGDAQDYHPPDFRGFRLLGERPSQSTQIQMGGGGSFMQTIYSWTYELAPTQKGTLTIGPAHVRVGGRDLRTSAASITVGDAPVGGSASPGLRRRQIPGFGFPRSLFDEPEPEPDPAPTPQASENSVRVVPDKTRAYVGEPITVEWFLYLSERQDKYQTVVEPHAEGFWTEDVPIVANKSGLSLNRQIHNGRAYLVAPLMKKVLFPLRAGQLIVTPLESEISKVDFFGTTARTNRLKTEPLIIEVLPLPADGQPPAFDPASVGRFTVAARLDRDKVASGEAVTLTVTITGQGNLRKLAPPRLQPLAGWKIYDPKISVVIDQGRPGAGEKTMEYLLLPEQAGTTIIPAFELPFFDPERKVYTVGKSAPLRVEVVGETGALVAGAAQTPHDVATAIGRSGGNDNVLQEGIRPPRARPTLRRDTAKTFYRSRAFVGVVAAPPLVWGFTLLVGRVRGRLEQDNERTRRRQRKKLVRRRLGAALAHMQAGQAARCFMEIDRVLRDFLAAKLGRNVTGLVQGELHAELAGAGLTADLAGEAIALLGACDRARFAPGDSSGQAMEAALDRAGDIIARLEKANFGAPPPIAAFVFVAVLGTLISPPARGDVIDDAWRRGNDAYFRSDYAGAVAAYEQIDRQGIVSTDLYYNLGVASFRQGRLGRAIWAFERTLALDPGDDDARFNLAQTRKFAAQQARDKIEGAERDPAWMRAVTSMSAAAETWIFLALFLGCFVLIFARRHCHGTSRAAVTGSVAILGAGAALAGVLLLGRMALDTIPFGVVLPDTVAVKEGADPNYRTSFDLHAGLRVRLLETDQNWVRIRLANGLEGWVRAQDVGKI